MVPTGAEEGHYPVEAYACIAQRFGGGQCRSLLFRQDFLEQAEVRFERPILDSAACELEDAQVHAMEHGG